MSTFIMITIEKACNRDDQELEPSQMHPYPYKYEKQQWVSLNAGKPAKILSLDGLEWGAQNLFGTLCVQMNYATTTNSIFHTQWNH